MSNLVLQKLVYFAHGRYLSETREPLVGGDFEAWQYGPVHPHVYWAFQDQGKAAIKTRAISVNPVTGKTASIPEIADDRARNVIKAIFEALKDRSPSNLVAISHAPNAPWRHTVDKAERRESISIRIPNEIIRERFRYHVISVSNSNELEVPNENSPFTGS